MQFALLGEKWTRRIYNNRYYLSSGNNYAYPYSLPSEVVDDLANRLNAVKMFDWKRWIAKFIEEPGYNDATGYGVTVSNVDNAKFDVIGVHHLLPDENRGLAHIFIDVLDKQNNRITDATIKWTWEGRIEPGLPDPVRLDKPPNEIVGLAIFGGAKINIWHPFGNGVLNLHAVHPDELGPNGEKWNTIGHHSFLAVFREIDEVVIPPPVEDASVLRIKKSWLDSQKVDEDGYIRIYD